MDRFATFCGDFQRLVAAESDVTRVIQHGSELVSELTSRPDWLVDWLEGLILDPELLAAQKPGIWPNEYTVFRSPDRSFVVLAYLWEAGLADTIHDHGSWGIIGTILGELEERKFERLDDGSREGFCQLREMRHGHFRPGETTHVLPFDEGLHAMCNPTGGMAASINVYGRSSGRGYIQFFDPANNRVTRAYPPRSFREILAVKAITEVDPLRAEGILRRTLDRPRSGALRREYEAVLQKARV